MLQDIHRSDTHSYYEESDATYDYRIRDKLHQRDVTEEILDVLREGNNSLMFSD